MWRSISIVLCFSILITMLSACNSERNIIYSNYRKGQIERHIGANGRYLQYTWLRTEDNIDLGILPHKPAQLGPDLVDNPITGDPVIIPSPNDDLYVEDFKARLIDVTDNMRRFDPGASLGKIDAVNLLPVAFHETLPREEPNGYVSGNVLGYVWTTSDSSRVPLYEWRRNTLLEQASFNDHAYSIESHPAFANNRYQATGIIAYLRKDSAPNMTAVISGYNMTEKNHVLTTDKTLAASLKDVHILGYISNTSSSASMAALKEYRLAPSSGNSTLADNWYSAIKVGNHFSERAVVAGGGDNPLYEGGIALATFSLEHLHNVSEHSLDYARLLFDYIEHSEEYGDGILTGSEEKTGLLRRRRQNWIPAQHNSSGLGWSSSLEELLGTLLGLKYFAKATIKAGDMVYYNRVVNLTNRIGTYLKAHYWVYADSRLPIDAGIYSSSPIVKERSLGTFAFQFALGRALKDITNYSYSGEDVFADQIDFWSDAANVNVPSFPMLPGVTSTGVMSCIANSILSYSCASDMSLSCGTNLDNPFKMYKLLVSNVAPWSYLPSRCPGKGLPQMDYTNHAIVLYSALLVLNAENDNINSDNRKELAKPIAKYVRDMLAPCDQSDQCNGDARYNVLFALVGKRAAIILGHEELGDGFGIHGEHRKKAAGKHFEQSVDKIIDRMIVSQDQRSSPIWQRSLPLGEPRKTKLDEDCITSDNNLVANSPPWWGSNNLPKGMGKGSAWRYKNFSMTRYNSTFWRNTCAWLKEIGPWYKSNGSSAATKMANNGGDYSNEATLKYLRKFLRTGYKDISKEKTALEPSRLVIEAGGNDRLFTQMMLFEIGAGPKPRVISDQKWSVLPVDGPSPW